MICVSVSCSLSLVPQKAESVNLPNSVHVSAYACIYMGYLHIYIYVHLPVLFVCVQLNGNVVAAVDLLLGKYMKKVSRAYKL